MRILEIREQSFPIASSIRNAVIDFSQMTVSVIALISDVIVNGERLVGYGFNSNGRYAPSDVIRKRFAPRLLSAATDSLTDAATGYVSPEAVQVEAMRNEKPGGHGERAVAAGVLDMAAWDLASKQAGVPLWKMVAERYGNGSASEIVEVYAAGGYYVPNGDVSSLCDEMSGYLDGGYTNVKMKIGGAPLSHDRARIEALLDFLPSESTLAVDANGRFGLIEALEYADALIDYSLAWYEEPCDPLDYQTLAAVAQVYEGVLATGENLMSSPDSLNLLRYGGLRPSRDVLQMDAALGYGLVEYARILAAMDRYGWSRRSAWPHGGHQFNLHLAAGLGLGGIESYPGLFQPFGGFADDEAVESGRVRLGNSPGIGFERKSDLFSVLESVLTSDESRIG